MKDFKALVSCNKKNTTKILGVGAAVLVSVGGLILLSSKVRKT
ncbi:hypothetical protein [Clostridium sardiniense]